MADTPFTPSRIRPFDASQIRTPILLRKVLGREMAPTRQEHARLAAGLLDGDPAMDAFIEDAFQSGKPARFWKMLDQVCNSSTPADVRECQSLNAIIDSASSFPFAVDWSLASEGAAFIHQTGTLATDVLRDMALMGGYMMSDFNQTLVMTGDLEKGADARLGNTSRWWLAVTDFDSNKPWAAGFRHTLRVRWVHAMVRRHLKNHPDWNAGVYGLPINQCDMAATYLGFSLVMLLGLRKCGVYVTGRQSRAVMHLWKIVAWQMGVNEQWLVDGEKQGIVLLRQLMMTHTPPDETTVQLARALAEEPLTRQYGSYAVVRRRLAWLAHLSSSSWLLGPSMMRKLGLSSPLGPWLKIMELVPATSSYYLRSVRKKSRVLKVRDGRNAQIRAVNELHSDARRVKKAGHPAHQPTSRAA